MLKKYGRTLLAAVIFTLLLFYILLKKIKYISELQMSSDDKMIKGKVIGKNLFLLTGDIHPIVQCNINGSEVTYTYRYFYSEKKYPIGTEVELKVSEISGLPYDKKDLVKDMIFTVFSLFFFSSILVACLYVILIAR